MAGLALLAAAVLASPAPAQNCDCAKGPCPPYVKYRFEGPPRICFKHGCPKPICDPCHLPHYGYYPVCWQPWPFPPDWSHCPVPPPAALVVPIPPKRFREPPRYDEKPPEERTRAIEELLGDVAHVAKAALVRDLLRHLEREEESGRRALRPAADRFRGRHRVEGGIDFHRIECARVDAEEIHRVRVLGIERPDPRVVVPSLRSETNRAWHDSMGSWCG